MPPKPIIIDEVTGNVLWRTDDCADYCGIGPRTWTAYSSSGRTPAVVAYLGKRSPLWDAEEVKKWHASRPGPPAHLQHLFPKHAPRSHVDDNHEHKTFIYNYDDIDHKKGD